MAAAIRRFALSAGVFLKLFKPSPAPDSLHEHWLKDEGTDDYGLWIADL
jgi:hypothetical protein